MSYIKRNARWNSTSFQLPIYPRSATREELGKIFINENNKFGWYVNPSTCWSDQWNVKFTEWGEEDTMKKAKKKIESFIKFC